MQGHWSELVDTICGLRGVYAAEFADLGRAVDVARGYVRELRFPTLLQELDEELLAAGALEADGLLADDSGVRHPDTPIVMALALAAYSLLYGDQEGSSHLEAERLEESCRRVAAFVLIEKMRRLAVYGRLSHGFDPWDDETPVVCEEENPAKLADFMRWLGYPSAENDIA